MCAEERDRLSALQHEREKDVQEASFRSELSSAAVEIAAAEVAAEEAAAELRAVREEMATQAEAVESSEAIQLEERRQLQQQLGWDTQALQQMVGEAEGRGDEERRAHAVVLHGTLDQLRSAMIETAEAGMEAAAVPPRVEEVLRALCVERDVEAARRVMADELLRSANDVASRAEEERGLAVKVS